MAPVICSPSAMNDVAVVEEKRPLVPDVSVRPGLSIKNGNNQRLGSRLAKLMREGKTSDHFCEEW